MCPSSRKSIERITLKAGPREIVTQRFHDVACDASCVRPFLAGGIKAIIRSPNILNQASLPLEQPTVRFLGQHRSIVSTMAAHVISY